MGVVREWCSFLGAEAGTPEAAAKVQAVTDLHAIAYRSWLAKRPGEKPRAKASAAPAGRAITTERRFRARKSEGLEATQSNATIAKKFAALRRIYRMWIASGFPIAMNPFDVDRVPPPSKDAGRKRPTEMVPFELVMRVVNEADPSTPKGLRDRAILAALFGGGLRRSEVVNLRVGDVRRSAKGTTYLYLRTTKAKRDAQQALPRWAAEVVQSLVAQRQAERAREADYLCVSYTGKGGNTPTPHPVSASGVYKLFKSYCARVGAGRFCTPHSARATAITRLLDAGIPHREVQEFSRHSSIQMVELYDKRRIGVDDNAAKDLTYEKK